MGAGMADPAEGGDGDLLCFVMRENFLIIFIQIFLINSLIFSDEKSCWRGKMEKV